MLQNIRFSNLGFLVRSNTSGFLDGLTEEPLTKCSFARITGPHHQTGVDRLVGLPLGQVRLPVLGLCQGRRLVREVGSVVIIAQVSQQLTTLLRI